MFYKGILISLALIVPQFANAGPAKISFDSAGTAQIKQILAEIEANIPAAPMPPRPAVEAFGESYDGTIVKLSPVVNIQDKNLDGVHYTWVPGLKTAIFNMTCKAEGNNYTWQLRLMKPKNLPERAGHDHAIRENLPAGMAYYPAPDLQAGAEYYIDGTLWGPTFSYLGEALTGTLGPRTTVTLKIPDPKYATSIALPLQFSGTCNSAETRYIDIMVPDLVPLPVSGTTYVLIGGEKGRTTHYSFTHHGTVETIGALKRLAARWRAIHPNSNKLVFNDISLPWGGAFDVFGDWNPSHSHTNHSFGVAADVSKLCVKKSNRAGLIRLMGEMGFTVRSEGDPTIKDGGLVVDSAANHYHIQYQPEINRLKDTFIPGTTIKYPINEFGVMIGVNEDQEQTDHGRGLFGELPETKYTKNCQSFMAYANDCKSPAIGSMQQKYCHCISLYSGLTPVAEKDEEPHGYDGCR